MSTRSQRRAAEARHMRRQIAELREELALVQAALAQADTQEKLNLIAANAALIFKLQRSEAKNTRLAELLADRTNELNRILAVSSEWASLLRDLRASPGLTHPHPS